MVKSTWEQKPQRRKNDDKSANELVVDGLVYDDYTASMELPHELTARVDGHEFTAGLMRGSRSYISADGEVVAKKIRWI
ncbi:MAG: hypothetical protein IJF49_07550 [Clostridia bacterium]|nr:hypothetical protein [Clostridia bacterium]